MKMNKKSLFLTIAMLFVAISSWGYGNGDIVYNYVDGKNDTRLIYRMSKVDETAAEGLTCVLVCINTTEESVVVPSTIFTKQNKTVKVVGAEYDGKYPTSIASCVKTIQFSENLTSFTTTFLGNYGKESNVEKLILPASLDSISSGGDATNRYYALKEIVLAEGCTKCQVYTTAENSHVLADKNGTRLTLACMRDLDGNWLKSFSVPEGITTGRIFIFHNSGRATIETINLPASFIELGVNGEKASHTFSHLASLKAYTVAADNPVYCAYEGVLYKKPVVDGKAWGETVVAIPQNLNAKGTFTVPEGVKVMDECSATQSKIHHIVLPEGLETIGTATFSYCTLMEITIPKTVTTIDEGVFASNNNLTAINVEEGNPKYASYDGVLYTNDYKTLLACPAGKTGDYALHANTETIGLKGLRGNHLTTLDLTTATGLKTIGVDGIRGSFNLTTITIPATVEKIEEYAFEGSAELSEVKFLSATSDDASLEFSGYALQACPKIKSIVFPKQLTKTVSGIRLWAETVSFEEGSRLTTLTNFAQSYCPNLKKVDLSNCTSLTYVPSKLVYYLDTVEEVDLPASISSINAQAFSTTPNLKTIKFAENTVLQTINENAFQDCGIETIDVPSNVRTIRKEAFMRCQNLKSITIPASATSINAQAFKYCNKLVEIKVDANNTKYASSDGMLTDKKKKTLLIFPPGKASAAGTMISPSITKIGDYACYACENLEAIVFPKYLESIGNHAFEFCDNLNSITFLGELPPANVDAEVAADNANEDYNNQDHRFGNADYSSVDFLKKYVTINLRDNGNQELYYGDASTSYWKNAKDHTLSFNATSGKNSGSNVNKYDYLATSHTAVMVLGSESTNPTAVVPASVSNGDKTYTVAMVGDYAFDHIPASVNEIVFLGPIEFIGANAFNDGHKDGVYKKNPTSTIKQIVFADATSVGQNQLSTQRFELGTEYGTENYQEFTNDQKIYVAKSKLEGYKTNMAKFAAQIDYKIPDMQINNKYGTFAREFDVDFSECAANGGDRVIAFTTGVKQAWIGDFGPACEYQVFSHSIFEGESADLDGVYVPANTGVLVKNMSATSTSEGFYYTVGEKKEVPAVEGNMMTGFTEAPETITAPANMYVMSSGQYRHVAEGTSITMPIHKAYLNLADAVEAGAKIVFLGEVETAIEAISNNEGNDDIYNLTGAKVSKMQSGIYVKNGKKIYVK